MGTTSRGYRESRIRTDKGAKFTRSCFNCDYYYKTMDDEGEVCQNPNVTRYDIVSDGTKVYCSYWKLVDDGSDSVFHRSRKAPLQSAVDRYFDSPERRARYSGSGLRRRK